MIHTEYRTSDIVLATVLKINGNQLVDIEVKGPRGVFVYADVDSEFLKSFDVGNIAVEPNDFHSILKQLTATVRRKLN